MQIMFLQTANGAKFAHVECFRSSVVDLYSHKYYSSNQNIWYTYYIGLAQT